MFMVQLSISDYPFPENSPYVSVVSADRYWLKLMLFTLFFIYLDMVFVACSTYLYESKWIR